MERDSGTTATAPAGAAPLTGPASGPASIASTPGQQTRKCVASLTAYVVLQWSCSCFIPARIQIFCLLILTVCILPKSIVCKTFTVFDIVVGVSSMKVQSLISGLAARVHAPDVQAHSFMAYIACLRDA